ncbi:MAG: sugar ABC transporter permease [Clostridia bacterium]|nr:sugar ABC transporter permease [Clostridia bacterium]
MKRNKNRGIEALKSRYGWICISPWIVGLVLFFGLPIIQSVIYTFSDVKLATGGLQTEFVGLENYKYIFAQNADYLDYIAAAVIQFLYSFPVILIISIILAIMLNQKFKGRIFFRALYFLPVIIASGAVLSVVLSSVSDGVANIETDESVAMAMFDVDEIVTSLGLPSKIGEYFVTIIDGIMNMIWNCGIQTVLFISGMQTIPPLLYEVSKVEGATKWEEFWFITLPMLSRVIVLVGVFTMVELMTAQNNSVMRQAYVFMRTQNYGEGSAMLWSYFAVIGVIMAVILGLYNRLCMRKWE